MNNIRAHFAYLKYVLRHKYFVFISGRKIGLSLWRCLTHDMSKFLPREWFPYVSSFYNPDGGKKNLRNKDGSYDPTKVSRSFDYAWKSHQQKNGHHWQNWVLINDEDGTYPLEIPEKYIVEMVADWIGAGKAQGTPDTMGWYSTNESKMILHPKSKAKLIEILDKVFRTEI